MRLSFTYTPEDFAEWSKSRPARSTAIKSSFRASRTAWVALIGFAVIFVVVVFSESRATTRPAAPPPPSGGNFLLGTLLPLLPWLLIFCGICAFVFRQLRGGGGREIWKANKDFHQPHELIVDADHVELVGPRTGSRFRIAAFDDFHETGNLFLLRLPPVEFVLIPKRAATAAQQDELRELFRSRIGKGPPGFPVGPGSRT